MRDRQLERALIVSVLIAIVLIAVAILVGVLGRPWMPARGAPSVSTISEAVLTLPGIDVYEFNTPGQMHCVLAVDRASKFARTPALSCIKISALKVDPRRWEKALPTPDQGT